MIRFRRDHAWRRSGDRNSSTVGTTTATALEDVTGIRDNGQEADAGYLDNNQNHSIAFRLDRNRGRGHVPLDLRRLQGLIAR